MRHLLTVMLTLLLILAAGCRSSTTAQAQGPAMTPEEVGAALTAQLELIVSKDAAEYTEADVALLKAIYDGYRAYQSYIRPSAPPPTGAGQQPTEGGDQLPAFMERPEDRWTNEEINKFGETKYRLDTEADPAPTQAEIDAMQEYLDYYHLYNEWLLQQGGEGGGEGEGEGEVPQGSDPYASVSSG